MTVSSEFYAAQAAECARAAGDSQLPRQREQLERAREDWQTLADRAAASAAGRDRRIAEAEARASTHL